MFTLKPRFRLETHKRIWDSQQSRWIDVKLSKPRLVPTHPQELTKAQKATVLDRMAKLAAYIKASADVRRAEGRQSDAAHDLIGGEGGNVGLGC